MEKGPLHFSIDLEWLTGHIRQVWSEGRYDNALGLLESSGCPAEFHADLIRGKIKMIGDEHGGETAPDDWTPNRDLCHRGTYPDPDELGKIATDGEKYRHLYFERLRNDYFDLCSRWEHASEGERLEDLAFLFRQFPDEFIETLDPIDKTPWNLSHRYSLVPSGSTAMGGFVAQSLGIPTVAKFVEHQIELENRDAPMPTTDLSSNYGWLLPDGRFYACKYWEHDGVASLLGKTVQEADAAGWIRIGYSKLMKSVSIARTSQAEIPQRQLDILFDWCVEHNENLPWWATNDQT